MSTKYKINNPEGIYFVTFTVVEWIDVFTRTIYKDLFLESLIYCQDNKGLVVYAWCLMSNHVHLILATKDQDLRGIIRDLKKYSSIRILKEIQSNPSESRKKWMLRIFGEHGKKNGNNTIFQFWIQNNQPKELLSHHGSFMMEKLDYIHNNPVKAGIVENPEDYIYSSARDYAGMKGLIPIEFLE